MRALLSALGLGVLGRRMLGIRLGRLYQHPPCPLSINRLAKTGDDDNLPLISLVTPSFNQAQFVGKTLESVVGQEYANLQYVVQDAMSGDGTAEVLRPYAGRGVDIRIEADRGQADALNRGFARTSGEIMGYLNSDDMLLPGALHLVGRYFRDHPSVDVVYGNRLIIDENGLEVGRWVLPGHDSQILGFVDYVPQESMFWRRSIWDDVGARFDANLQFAMDWDLILRFIDIGAVFHHLPELFGVFRAHGSQKSQANFLTRGTNEMADLRRRHSRKDMGRIRRAVLHWRYLSRHRQADAAFKTSLLN
ncbi:glycosyltransferase family 2 protein [Burkholderia sp. L27(2015)]|uniref:glycosyltransferase family 2 protein n=1 Tax=Burkholderia sp. L27(2015) TaxID=1641858 RepID=UPI00131C6415|nr:glycosyltransferase family 2 protein [Burkholderia sp. L27(2015)]